MIEVRRIRSGEWKLYREIRLKALKDAPYAYSSTYKSALEQDDASWKEQSEKAVSGGDRCLLFVLSDKVVIGMVAVYRNTQKRKEGEVFQVWLSQDFRGKGVARDLMDSAFYWCFENNIEKLYAGITKGNDRALRFYEKIAFKCDSSCRHESECETYLVKEIGIESSREKY